MQNDSDNIAETDTPAERKSLPKEGIALLVVVALGAGGLYLMHNRSSVAEVTPTAAEADLAQFLSRGSDHVQAISANIAKTRRLLTQFETFPAAQQVAFVDLGSDPFAPTSATPLPAQPEAQDEREMLRAAAAELRLQSVVHSSNRRTCLIDGRLYREGQKIDIFTIESIRADGIVLKRDRHRFELKLSR